MSEEGCIFCDIVAGKIPCYKVYEDERTLAFMDINPVTPGHVLVIPKTHVREPASKWCPVTWPRCTRPAKR